MRMPSSATALATAIAFALSAQCAMAADSKLETVQVTATRTEESVDRVPAAITVITGEELRARGARDLTGALALVAGVEISSGGDGGPAGSVPAFMGLREFDAFLLVVDNVPYGGAFNPQLTTLDLNNVERIEVLRGAAPVTFGATSFVGVIHVIHYAAGKGPEIVSVGAGTHSSGYARGTFNLSDNSSLSVDLSRRGLEGDAAGYDKLLALYRTGFDVGEGRLDLDVGASRVDQDPTSPQLREGPRLTLQTPLDANHNPSDAEITEQRLQVNAHFEQSIAIGELVATGSLAHTSADITRGFLTDLGNNPAVPNAAGYRQDRSITDGYLDVHVNQSLGDNGSWSFGADWLGGKGELNNELFSYFVPLNGRNRPSSHSVSVSEENEAEDERNFFGVYAQADWSVTPNFDVLAGLRLNHTSEDQDGEEDINGVPTDASDDRTTTRATGHIGASFRAYDNGGDSVTVYADYRNSFKPAAYDFGPEAEADVLETEDTRAVEVGVKQRWLDGTLDIDFSAYRLDFNNVVVPQNVNGQPGLVNAGEINLDGYEAEAQWHFAEHFSAYGAWAYHKAIFGDYQRLFGSTLTQLRGKTQELAPRHTRALGLMYGGDSGLQADVVYSYIGERFLNKRNTALAGDYDTFDARVGWNFDKWGISVAGHNLTDKRPPIAESEIGDAQYYRLPARYIEADITFNL